MYRKFFARWRGLYVSWGSIGLWKGKRGKYWEHSSIVRCLCAVAKLARCYYPELAKDSIATNKKGQGRIIISEDMK